MFRSRTIIVSTICLQRQIENLEGLKDIEMVAGSILDNRRWLTSFATASTPSSTSRHALGAEIVGGPVATHHANATGTLSVLECRQARLAATRHSRLVVVGLRGEPRAPKARGHGPDSADEPLRERANSPLRATRSPTDARFGMDVLAFRFFNVFGPLQAADHAYAAVIPAFIAAAL